MSTNTKLPLTFIVSQLHKVFVQLWVEPRQVIQVTQHSQELLKEEGCKRQFQQYTLIQRLAQHAAQKLQQCRSFRQCGKASGAGVQLVVDSGFKQAILQFCKT